MWDDTINYLSEFYQRRKKELEADIEKIKDSIEFTKNLFEYLEITYNNKHSHETLINILKDNQKEMLKITINRLEEKLNGFIDRIMKDCLRDPGIARYAYVLVGGKAINQYIEETGLIRP